MDFTRLSLKLFLLLILSPMLVNGAAHSQDNSTKECLQVGCDAIAKQFAASAQFRSPTLSPSGSKIAAIGQSEDDVYVEVFDLLDTGQMRSVTKISAGNRLTYYAGGNPYGSVRWLNDRFLFVTVFAPRSSTFEFVVYDSVSGKVSKPFSKLFPTYQVWNSSSSKNYSSVDQTGVVDWPNTTDKRLLLALFKDKTRPRHSNMLFPSVYSFDQSTLGFKKVAEPKKDVIHWIPNGKQELLIGLQKKKSGATSYLYRPSENDKWMLLRGGLEKPGVTFEILKFSVDEKQVWVLSNHRTPRAELFLFDLKSKSFSEPIASHDKFDVSHAEFDPEGELRAVYAGEVPVFLEASETAVRSQLISQTGASRIGLISKSHDERKRVYQVSSTGSKGAFYLYDQTSGLFSFLEEERTDEVEIGFENTSTHEITTSDGLNLDAYITLPAGVELETVENLPFIVLPHGGPWARDFTGYDELAQFFAAKGLGVVKVNFRGSTGYGADFEALGFGQWGLSMQRDISETRDWVVAQGLADPAKICIVGWSYGGYAALMEAVHESANYKCAASIAGVTDLVKLIRDVEDKEIRRRIGYDSKTGMNEIRSRSPSHQADKIAIPIFLAHGTDDDRVDFDDQYVATLKTMRKAGVDVDYLALSRGDHSLSGHYNRQILYERLSTFLDRHLFAN